MQPKKVSKQLLMRLPVYLNYLKSLPEDVPNISATMIARNLDLGEVQVRKDLARVSDGGRCKTGHTREKLIADIEAFLDFSIPTGAVIVGAGMLGRALLDFADFEKAGLQVRAGFDLDPAVSQSKKGKGIYPIHQLEDYCLTHDIRVGIITVPSESAQEVCDRLVASGVQAIWNFVPVTLRAPAHVVVHSENLAISAANLRMKMIAAGPNPASEPPVQ